MTEQRFDGSDRGGGARPQQANTGSVAVCTPPVSAGTRVREALAQTSSIMVTQHYSARSVEAYVGWLRRFLRFHWPRDPAQLDHTAVAAFLSALAIKGRVSASTQNQARSALVFFFRHVVRAPLPTMEGVTPASRPQRLPVVLSVDEVSAVLRELRGAKQLVAMLLYGSGFGCSRRLRFASRASISRGPSFSSGVAKGTRTGCRSCPECCTRHCGCTWCG